MKLAPALALALAALPVAAQANPISDYCYSFAEAAGSIMDARQAGVPASTMYAIATQDPAIAAASSALVDSAMASPRYATTADQGAAVAVFRERARSACLRRFW